MVPPFVNPCDYGPPEPCGVNPSFVYTRYPCDFDDPRPTDTRGLPVTVDNQTPVKAEVVNRQRESILAIEAELGIQPSGTFTTVRARLDALEGLLCAIWDRLQDTGSPVNISLNGTTIVTGVENINFTGTGVTVVNAGGNQADISITGGVIEQFVCNIDGYMPVHIALPVALPSQTIFALPHVPYNELVLLFVGGIKQEIGDYIVTADQVEWLGTDLIVGDVVEAFYTVYGGQGDGYEPIHEALPVDSNGQTAFFLSETPWNNLVLFFLGGIKQEISDYTVNGNAVTWTGSTPLITSDVVEVIFYKRIPGENCGSGSILSVADESVIVENNVELIDFQGIGVTAVGDGAGKVTVTVQGATTIMHQEVFAATTSQTAFNVMYTPLSEQSTELFIDGVSQTVGTDYTISGNTITYSGTPSLTGGEAVVVKYFEDLSVVTNPGLPNVLYINNTTDGYDIDFGNNSRGVNALDPINAQDLATKAYVDAVAGFQNLAQVLAVGNSAGGYNIDLALSSTIINVPNPTNLQDVATKDYVDSLVSGTVGLPTVLSINNTSGGSDIVMTGNSAIHSADAVGATETLTLRTGNSTTGNAGILSISGGNTSGNANAASVVISAGNAPLGQLSSAGGALSLYSGNGGLSAGAINLTGGNANTSNAGSFGGNINLTAGTGYTNGKVYIRTANGIRTGDIELQIGTANTFGGSSGSMLIASGDSTASGVNSGSLTVRAGDSTLASGGSTTVRAGNATSISGGTAGSLTLQGGTGNIASPASVAGNVNVIGGSAGLTGGNVLITGGNANTSTVGSNGGSIIMHPGDGDTVGSVIANISNTDDGYFEVISNSGTGIHIGAEAVASAAHNYALVWDSAGYNKYMPMTGGSGYLGVDVFVTSVSDLPAPIAGLITLASNTVYGIDGSIDIGSNTIVTSNGSKIIGGGGSSTNSAIVSSNVTATLSISSSNVSVDGVLLQNTNSAPALRITSGEQYKIVDTTLVSNGSVTVRISGVGLGQISDSFIYVASGGNGIGVKSDTTSVFVHNTTFKGVGAGDGNGVHLFADGGSITVSQIVIEGCRFEDLGIPVKNSDAFISGNLAVVNCSGINLDTFIRTEVGAYTQASVISSNSAWNCVLFNVGLTPGGNQVFRGNIMQGVAQTESPIV